MFTPVFLGGRKLPLSDFVGYVCGVYVCLYVCGNMHVCAYMWKPEVVTEYFFITLVNIFFPGAYVKQGLPLLPRSQR